MSKLNLNTQVFKILLSIIMLSFPVLMASCGAVAPSVTPTLTPISTQTATVTPTIIWFPATETPTPIANISPTPQPTFESQREGISSLLVDDDFSSQSLWLTSQGTSGNVAGLFAIPNEFTRIGLDIELMSILVRGKDPRTTRIYYLINPKRY